MEWIDRVYFTAGGEVVVLGFHTVSGTDILHGWFIHSKFLQYSDTARGNRIT